MTKEEFKRRRIEGRDQLLSKIVETFKVLGPVAIHQFGSGAKGFKDEFSDLDIWITFLDNDIDKVLNKLSYTFEEISSILVKHHSRSWSPVGGASYSIIHEIGSDLFVVDYYISKLSETVLKNDSVVLYGDDSLKKGEWILNRHVNEKLKDTHTLRKDIDLFLDLIFISFKVIVRNQKDSEFINTLKLVHNKFDEHYPGSLRPRRINLNFRSNSRLLGDLSRISNKRQKRVINKIQNYARRIDKLYLS